MFVEFAISEFSGDTVGKKLQRLYMSFADDGADENMLCLMLLIVGNFNSWKLFYIIDKRIFSNNLNHLQPKLTHFSRNLFFIFYYFPAFHEKFVLDPADKASNNALVV